MTQVLARDCQEMRDETGCVGAAIVPEKKWAQALGAELIDLVQAFRWGKGKSVTRHMDFYYRACLWYNM